MMFIFLMSEYFFPYQISFLKHLNIFKRFVYAYGYIFLFICIYKYKVKRHYVCKVKCLYALLY